MNDDISEELKAFNAVVKDAQIFLFMARDSELQRASIAELCSLGKTVKTWKQEAVAEKDEDRANLFLGMECVAQSLIAELNMWLLLKAEEPEQAWDRLVAAQMATRDAIRAHAAFAHAEAQAERLHVVEKTVFPPQIFLSAGLIVRRDTCTICGIDYEDCPHLVGLPYVGEFCRRRLTEVTADHIAIVDEPANKVCRFTHFSDEGGKRNRMTWRLEHGDSQEQSGKTTGLQATGVIFTANDLKP